MDQRISTAQGQTLVLTKESSPCQHAHIYSLPAFLLPSVNWQQVHRWFLRIKDPCDLHLSRSWQLWHRQLRQGARRLRQPWQHTPSQNRSKYLRVLILSSKWMCFGARPVTGFFWESSQVQRSLCPNAAIALQSINH